MRPGHGLRLGLQRRLRLRLSRTGALAIELLHKAGIPRDVVQIVPGDGKVGGIDSVSLHGVGFGYVMNRMIWGPTRDDPRWQDALAPLLDGGAVLHGDRVSHQ